VAALRSRILSYDGVKTIENISVSMNLAREMKFTADIKLHSGETFTIAV
jgi:hypothetical protein